MILTVSGEEGNGSTLRTGTTSSADTMDVILGVVGVIIVEHVSNVAHIFKARWLAIEGVWNSDIPGRTENTNV